MYPEAGQIMSDPGGDDDEETFHAAQAPPGFDLMTRAYRSFYS